MTTDELAVQLLRGLRSRQPNARGYELILILRKLGDPGVGGHASYVRTGPEAHPPRVTEVEMLMTSLAALCKEDPTLVHFVRICLPHLVGDEP